MPSDNDDKNIEMVFILFGQLNLAKPEDIDALYLIALACLVRVYQSELPENNRLYARAVQIEYFLPNDVIGRAMSIMDRYAQESMYRLSPIESTQLALYVIDEAYQRIKSEVDQPTQ